MPKKLLVLFLVFIMVAVIFSGCLGPGERPRGGDDTAGSQGISWAELVPVKKTTFVGYDPESYIDDYAYMAAVPASVFYSEDSGNLYSNPLMFYDAPKDVSDDEMRTFNANPGIKYFMEDWSTYTDGQFDSIELINIRDSDMSDIESMVNNTKFNRLSGTSSAEVAKNIALANWQFSDAAVVAVVRDDYKFEPIITQKRVSGTTPSASVQTGAFDGEAEPDPVNPIFHPFDIGEDYKYVNAVMTWGEDYNPIKDITERGKDPDLQLYDEQLGEVAASEEWNVLSGASEQIGSYVYHSGGWKAAVTYMPTETLTAPLDTESAMESLMGPPAAGTVEDQSQSEPPEIGNPLSSTVKYTIDYTLYPGVDLELPDDAPYGCRNAYFNLYWEDSSQQLGLIVRGSSGAEIATAMTAGNDQSIELAELGEGEYSVAVINMGDNAQATDFEVEYTWEKLYPDEQVEWFASASEGAVYASTQNIPLLYTTPGSLNKHTREALDTLGVTKVYLVDIGKNSGSSIKDELGSYRLMLQDKISVEQITSYSKIYNMIRESTKVDGEYQNDIVFSTINPWSTWKTVEGLTGEQARGLYIGPATFAAAHHGCPVFITDSDARLSNSQAWHNEYWKNAWAGRYPPSVGCMVLSGREVYDYVQEYGFDDPDEMESILTVAGQFDIGTTWDRMLVGAAATGRIMGSPVDTGYWVARSAFYQSMIFANPAVTPELDEHDGMRITGSSSVRTAGALRIVEDEHEVQVENPVLQTWVSYQHRFNERGGKYWGAEYVTATGITPFYTRSDNELEIPLGGVYPDLSSSIVIPYYLETAGYGTMYTTNFETSMENINRGAIMWLEVMHGGNRDSGIVGFWDEGQPESNPWRGYEENAMTLRGSTADPDTVSMNKKIGLDLQPGFSGILPDGPVETHDGVIIAIAQQQQTVSYNGLDFDDAMANLHSMGFSAGSCLIANTYLQLALVRHGSVFQIIDPWLTSWYSCFAMEMFVRDLILGYNVGEAYTHGIEHVGIQYLTEKWWWDIFENVVYFGDPDLRVYTPMHEWERPTILKRGIDIAGHVPSGVSSHPYAIKDTTAQEAALFGTGIVILIAIPVAYVKRDKVKKILKRSKSAKQ